MQQCSFSWPIHIIEENLEDIAKELKDWANGGKNEKLDKWFEAWEVKR